MIKDSAKHLFEVVLVWKLDRFSRNRYDSALNKAALRKNGVKVVSAKENISDGPEGIILESMLEGYAEYYSAELSEKIHRGQKENALKGKNNGGGIPLGYLLGDEQKLVVDPLTALIVQYPVEHRNDCVAQSLKNLLLVRMMLPFSSLEQMSLKSSSTELRSSLHVPDLVHNQKIRTGIDTPTQFKPGFLTAPLSCCSSASRRPHRNAT